MCGIVGLKVLAQTLRTACSRKVPVHALTKLRTIARSTGSEPDCTGTCRCSKTLGLWKTLTNSVRMMTA